VTKVAAGKMAVPKSNKTLASIACSAGDAFRTMSISELESAHRLRIFTGEADDSDTQKGEGRTKPADRTCDMRSEHESSDAVRHHHLRRLIG